MWIVCVESENRVFNSIVLIIMYDRRLLSARWMNLIALLVFWIIIFSLNQLFLLNKIYFTEWKKALNENSSNKCCIYYSIIYRNRKRFIRIVIAEKKKKKNKKKKNYKNMSAVDRWEKKTCETSAWLGNAI